MHRGRAMVDPTDIASAREKRDSGNAHPNEARLGADLPLAHTSFVGREREVEAVTGLFQQSRARLVTLTGPGGVGKTRLAIAVAQDLAAEVMDDVLFVDLTSITDPDLVAAAVAEPLGVRETLDGLLLKHL